ncbi:MULTISPECIES: hypothetical protein [unclassified Pseudodesulfovibrio]|uniref:Ppx/GppA phosphatase family protein n=1 Tax=unclassified Pseudodesulfovibrio TaxID=2661612 RepID=UPI000FEBC35D|nr:MULTISPECIES: hypothetical protein [unclassified Pseudodesulfovibrio]MCJ2166099.1 hypothetical protein [Pseudodesulfovibrio sp. S3-i]RWU02451.1 hypothetical protein DWB63_16210 [Pseudodesulfovibrio sp. S3]
MSILTRVFLTGLLACLCYASASPAQDTTVVRRAAFDIGSAVIKCTIADVDIPTGHIVKTIETLSEKVDFAEDLARSYDNNLSKEIMAQGIIVLKKLKAIAEQHTAQEYSAVGGKVFQDARNGRAYFVSIKKETGISSRIISEQQAAMLSYHAVRQELNSTSRDLLVWDIGAGSMQMTLRRQDGGLLFYIDPMSSVSFKNIVIGSIQKKDVTTTTSPNPVSAGQVEQALTFIRSHAAVTVPPLITSRLHQSNLFVAGIGGVHYYGVPEMMGVRKESYTRDDVARALQEWTDKPDADFNSEFADARLTNLILVLGYMDALDIKEVYPLKINQADGLFAAREFW